MDQTQRPKRDRQRKAGAWARHEVFKSRLVRMVDGDTLREMARIYARCTELERRDVYRQLLRMVFGPSKRT
jgi:hypothetical protein